MAKFIPVEPEKWAEMVKAMAENARLKALTAEMDKTINASQAECRRLKAEVERLTELNATLWKTFWFGFGFACFLFFLFILGIFIIFWKKTLP